MRIINAISNSPNQQIVLVLDDGTKLSMTLNYLANQQGWFYSLNYNNSQWVVNNRRIVTSPNMLRAFRNIIPFGLAITCSDGNEPVFIDDFSDGRVKLYLLDASDVLTVEGLIPNAN